MTLNRDLKDKEPAIPRFTGRLSSKHEDLKVDKELAMPVEEIDANVVKKLSYQESHTSQGRKWFEVKLERLARARL